MLIPFKSLIFLGSGNFLIAYSEIWQLCLQTGHVIEIVTKLFLVVQNATGKPPAVNIGTQFDANFGTHSVTFQFKVTNGRTVFWWTLFFFVLYFF